MNLFTKFSDQRKRIADGGQLVLVARFKGFGLSVTVSDFPPRPPYGPVSISLPDSFASTKRRSSAASISRIGFRGRSMFDLRRLGFGVSPNRGIRSLQRGLVGVAFTRPPPGGGDFLYQVV